MRKFYFMAAMGIALSLQQSAAQVMVTRKPLDASASSKPISVPSVTSLLPKSVLLSAPDVTALLAQDAKQTSGPTRFARALPVQIDLRSGKWEDTKDGRIWRCVVEAPKAYSLHFLFQKLILPDSAKLYIYNLDQTLVIGPVQKSNLTSGTFATDLINGSSAVLELYEPAAFLGKSDLLVNRVYYGYKPVFVETGFGSSGSCNVNINCPAGNNWQAQSNGVCVLLTNTNENSAFCSGTLLNNTCQNFLPNVLTAFHCLDTGDGVLQQSERDQVANWLFRFQYKSPTCSPSQNATNYITFTGATFLSAWRNSDFALLRMNQRPLASSGIQYVGWSRTGTTPNSVVCIHHPAGDVMKIATDGQSPTITTITGSANSHWFVDTWDTGTTEGGSSGSALFDQNGRVIGQDHAGDGYPACDPNKGTYFGRFNISWTGGATSDSRLSDWLSNDPNTTEVNTIQIPSVSGPAIFCTAGTFTLNNAPPGATVTWSVSPSYAVTTSSGTGSVANLTFNSNSDATITFQVGCGTPATFSTNFHVGDYSSSNYPVSGPTNAGCFQTVYYSTNQLPGATSYTWFWPSNWTYISGQGTNQLAVQTGGSGSSGTVGVRVGACGGSGGSPATRFTSVNCSFRLAAEVFPNPASEQVEIVGGREVSGEGGTRSVVVVETGSYNARLYNAVGHLARSGKSTNGKLSFDVQQLPDGVYTLRLDDGSGKPLTKRVVIAH